jgi:hypothetical protein
MNFRLSQTHLMWIAGGLLFLVVDYFVWAGLLEPVNRDLEALPREMDRVGRLLREAQTKRDREKDLYTQKKSEWIARHEKDLAAARAEVAADWAALAAEARKEAAALREKTALARAELAVERTEVQLQSEIRRQLNAVSAKHEIADADRQINVTSRVNGQTGWLEITVQFQFKLRYDSAVALVEKELEQSLPFLAVESLRLSHVTDQRAAGGRTRPDPKADPKTEKAEPPDDAERMLLAGTLTGYVYPAAGGAGKAGE